MGRQIIFKVAVILSLQLTQFLVESNDECATYWTAYNDNCYRYFPENLSWKDALEACRGIGRQGGSGYTDLVSIHSQAEEDFIYYYWRSYRDECVTDRRLWIGLSDKDNEGTMKWSDGSTLDFTTFDTGQPDNTGGNEDFVVIWDVDGLTPNTWNDEGYNYACSFMCKQPKHF